MPLFRLSAVALALSLVVACQADAALIISNLPGSPLNGGGSTIGGDAGKAVAFQMPLNGPSYYLDDIAITVQGWNTNASGTDSVRVQLFSSKVGSLSNNTSGARPDALLTTLSGPSPVPPNSNAVNILFTATPQQTILQAGQIYWVVVTDPSPAGDGVNWNSYASPFTSDIVPAATHVGNIFGSVAAVGNWNGVSGVANAMRVRGAIVPEPGSVSLLALVAMGLARRRR